MTVEVTLWPQVSEDYRALPSVVQFMAWKHLLRLETEPCFGQALTDHPIWGDLSDCRKVFLDESHEANPRWRIIYRLLPDERRPKTADVIIIGPREDDEVYRAIMSRLKRPLGPEHPGVEPSEKG